MSYLEFDRSQLINLEYSLDKEFLRTNRAGSYASSTLVHCHTRKYHGLLIVPLSEVDGGWYVLLSAVDETVIQGGKEFHLGIRKYPNLFHPGHKYLTEFRTEPIPSVTYRVGDVILKKELLLAYKEETVLIRYTLIDAHSPVEIELHPFLAFRNIHALSKANSNAIQKYIPIKNGIKTKMYEPFPNLHIQLSKETEYISAPDWYYNVEFIKEQERGYDFTEDLYVPGHFKFTMEKGETIVLAAGTEENKPSNLKQKFKDELKTRIPCNSFENCLQNSAEQFFVKKGEETEIVSSYPFLDRHIRKTFVSLPGLTLPWNKIDVFKNVIDTLLKKYVPRTIFFGELNNPDFFPSVSTPLWYIWSLQQLDPYCDKNEIWKKYGKIIRQIFAVLKNGTEYNIGVKENGLLYAGNENIALTWMDNYVNGKPVLPRSGYAVEVNALWYNAVKFVLKLAKRAKSNTFADEWKNMPEKIEKSFIDTFWNDDKKYLADYVLGDFKDWSVRPNQIFAASLPYSPLNDEMRKNIVDIIQRNLLTPRGLRTLSPEDKNYIAFCEGSVDQREIAAHQGSVWPWLLSHFAEAYLKLHKKNGILFIENLYKGFEEEMHSHGIGSISQIYDGNPPFVARGAISQASSVAEISRMKLIIDKYKNE